tara:strand:- start:15789 stop:15965 length:177 start_codon:yes stop_codon:yes gene_type:complete
MFKYFIFFYFIFYFNNAFAGITGTQAPKDHKWSSSSSAEHQENHHAEDDEELNRDNSH